MALCFPGDPLPFTPDWALLLFPALIPEVDQYGFLGFPETRQNPDIQPTQNWDVCPFTDFCDGPDVYGVGQPTRFVQRWRVKLEPNAFATWDVFLSKVGAPWAPADPLLFPASLPLPTEWITFSFDANGLPCFAWDDSAGLISLRRFVGGIPTTYNWAGTSPRLLFDGILQRDNTLTDLVCFYTRGGALYARFQRDNWAVEYLLANAGLGAGIDHLTKTDRVLYLGANYQYLYAVSSDPTPLRILLQSAPYPPWPVFGADAATLGVVPAGGLYFLVTIPAPPAADLGGTLGVIPGGGLYHDNTVLTGPYADAGMLGVIPAGGAYILVAVLTGPYADASTLGVIHGGGSYNLVAVLTGPYPDAGTLGVTPGGGAYT